ncbi:MAG: HAD hydrolase-like protein [Desulfobacteraceae bacterium]|nr:HAD hydrolase-like protein [Desulfobacteraceae bacterium]
MLLNFDYDGVIVDSLGNLLDLTIKARELVGVGKTPTRNDFATLEDMTYEELARVIEIPEDKIPRFIETVRDLERRPPAPTFLFPDISNVFEQLARDHEIVVITASTTETVTQILEENGLSRTVAKVMGGELGLSKAKRIAMAQNDFDSAPGDTAMIGDAVSDIRQGKLARVKTVAVTWGFQSRDLLIAERPDLLADTPMDLLTLFN